MLFLRLELNKWNNILYKDFTERINCMNYNLFKNLTEEQKSKYIITSKSTDEYPHLYTPAYSPSRHFSACIERNMDTAHRKDICRYAIFLTSGRCAYCGDKLINLKNGKKYRNKDLNWDHILPASKCNILTYGNILLSCSKCNTKKSDRDTLSWFKEQLEENNFPNAMFTYKEFESLLNTEFKQYVKDYSWAKIVNTKYFHHKDNEKEKEFSLREIHDEMEIYSFSQNSLINNYPCSKHYLDEIQILLDALPEEDKVKDSYIRFDQTFRNNFGKIECFLKNEIKSLLIYEDFIYAFQLFGSISKKDTYLKINQLLNKIVKYYFKKDYCFPSFKERIIYLKDIE